MKKIAFTIHAAARSWIMSISQTTLPIKNNTHGTIDVEAIFGLNNKIVATMKVNAVIHLQRLKKVKDIFM